MLRLLHMRELLRDSNMNIAANASTEQRRRDRAASPAQPSPSQFSTGSSVRVAWKLVRGVARLAISVLREGKVVLCDLGVGG